MKKIMIFLIMFSFIFSMYSSLAFARGARIPRMTPIKESTIYYMWLNEKVTSPFNVIECNKYIKTRLNNRFYLDKAEICVIQGRIEAIFVEEIGLSSSHNFTEEEIKEIAMQVYKYFEEYYSYSVYKEIK